MLNVSGKKMQSKSKRVKCLLKKKTRSIYTSFTDWPRQQFGVKTAEVECTLKLIYSQVRKLSLSILVAARTDSMSCRMSELSASWRLGISSSPSTAMLSPSRVPKSTSVPGISSR